MSGLVIDATAVLAWCFEDEAGPEADALIEQVAAEGAAVPGLWSLELANGLVMGERRGRITPAQSAAFVAMIEELPIASDPATGARALHETMSLAREHRLTAYDAAYLELAMRLGLSLATGDRSLGAAAELASPCSTARHNLDPRPCRRSARLMRAWAPSRSGGGIDGAARALRKEMQRKLSIRA